MTVPINHAVTNTVAALLFLLMLGVAAVSIRRYKTSKSPQLYAVIGTSDFVLRAMWAGATLCDDGDGAASLPGIVMTAPWSFLAIFLAIHGPAGALFTSGWLGNFIENFGVFVVLCGGMNNLLLYFLIRRRPDGKDESRRSPPEIGGARRGGSATLPTRNRTGGPP